MFKIQNSTKTTLDYKFFVFPGGEVGIKLNTPNPRFFTEGDETYKVTANLHNSNDAVALAMIKNAIENEYSGAVIDLFMPYVPYARQDRICDRGEAFSLKVFTNFINSLNFNSVTICDPHSDVTPALLDRVVVINQLDIISKFECFRARIQNSNCVFVSPDAGSNKKVSKLAGFFGHSQFIRADKLRNLATGQIKETVVYCDDLGGVDVAIVDDLGDGMGTFLALAKVLKGKNAGKIILYITHCIASKGFKLLFDGGIDELYTTDSYTAGFVGYIPEPPKLNIFKL